MVTQTTPDGLITVDGPQQFVDLAFEALALVDVDPVLLLNAPVRVQFVDKLAPPAPPFAEGLWRRRPRRADLVMLRRPDGSPRAGRLRYHVLHEVFGHATDLDRLDGKRARVRALMAPGPSTWSDVDGLDGMAAYWRLPSECFANRMVEAITKGRVRSPFDDDYTRWIPDARLADLVAIVVEPPPSTWSDVEQPVEPMPEPPSPLDLLRSAVLTADADIRATLDALVGFAQGSTPPTT